MTAQYKGHSYRINRDTGYVEVDGQPITVTNGDPERWAKQYIDKTVALHAAKEGDDCGCGFLHEGMCEE